MMSKRCIGFGGDGRLSKMEQTSFVWVPIIHSERGSASHRFQHARFRQTATEHCGTYDNNPQNRALEAEKPGLLPLAATNSADVSRNSFFATQKVMIPSCENLRP
jgi:hypothetical protein